MFRLFRRVERIASWLGPARSQAFFILLAFTGLVSLILNAVTANSKNPADVGWVVGAQSILFLGFLIGTFIIFLTRLSGRGRQRALIIIVPALLAVVLTIAFPAFWILFLPAGIGWIFVAFVASQGRVRQEYQAAIKHLRKNEYEQAIEVMTDLVKAEPDSVDHRRFRAELYRLSGKNYRARADYEKVIDLLPKSALGYNGLAEVYLQDGEHDKALDYALQAYTVEPEEWVTAYNLGMIEDRLEHAADTVTHLNSALKSGIPDSRNRLLAHFWLVRAYARLEDATQASTEIAALKRERTGLSEWKTIFDSQQAKVLRSVLEPDVNLAERLMNDQASLVDLHLEQPA